MIPKPEPGNATSDDEVDDGAPLVDDKMMASAPKSVLNCANASECDGWNLFRSDFLPDFKGDCSWQGQLWGHCLGCSELTPAEFRRAVRRAWEQRAKLMRGRRQRARCINFSNIEAVFKEAYPGASNTQIRNLTVLRTRAMAGAFLKAFDEMTEADKQIVDEINQEYLKELDKAAADPSYAASARGHTLSNEESQFLTVIADGISESFVCRMPTCLYFGMNDQWVKHKTKWWFKCPRCGEQFHPSMDYKDSVKFNKVIGLFDPVTNETSFIPAVWAPSEAQGWLAKQVERNARLIRTEADVEAWHSRVRMELHTLISNQKLPTYFTNMGYDPSIENRFPETTWDCAPLKQRGHYAGALLSSQDAEKPPFTNWDELIGLIAGCVASSRAVMTSRM